MRPRLSATEIAWWHAMSGELGRQLEKLASDFNASQAEYRVTRGTTERLNSCKEYM